MILLLVKAFPRSYLLYSTKRILFTIIGAYFASSDLYHAQVDSRDQEVEVERLSCMLLSHLEWTSGVVWKVGNICTHVGFGVASPQATACD